MGSGKLAKKIAVITHRRSDATNEALLDVLRICRGLGVEAVVPRREVEKNPRVEDGALATVIPSLADAEVEFCVALGGDGTILRAFSKFPGMRTPILGINFGRIGFLSAISRDEISTRLARIIRGEFDLVGLNLLKIGGAEAGRRAVNDVVVHKLDSGSVIDLEYRVNGIPMDRARCDGMLVSTPAGSSAYNLSVGGPLMSMNLDAYILSAIAPHTLRARPLVLARGESVTIINRSTGAAAAVYVDGRLETELAPDAQIGVSLSEEKAALVQPAGSEFYRRLRDKFIRPES